MRTDRHRRRGARGISSVLLAALLLAAARAAAGEPPTAEEVRESRCFRAEPSLARRALALPYGILAITAVPVRPAVHWIEQVNLPDRLATAFRYPWRELPPTEDTGGRP